jgi:hypothetical protein
MFPGDLATLYETIVSAQEKYGHDLTIEEVRALHRIQWPSLTRVVRNNLEEVLTDLESSPALSPDVALDVLSGLWRQETYREIAEQATLGIDGKVSDLEGIRRIVESRAENFLPLDELTEIPTDLDDLLALNASAHTWKMNIPGLAKVLPGVSEGEFGIIFARPEVGKTASYCSLSCAPGGWCWQGAKVHVICNEEPGRKTLLRAVTAACQEDKEWVVQNRAEAKVRWARVASNFRVQDGVGMSLGKLDTYVRRNRPDILIVDQLDKLAVSGNFNGTHERLGALYIGAREIAKKHRCFVLGLSQASADAEGKAILDYSMMAGSKTDKAAEADWICGVGKYSQTDGGEENFTRPWTLSKNKISGIHCTVYTKLEPKISTYTD